MVTLALQASDGQYRPHAAGDGRQQ